MSSMEKQGYSMKDFASGVEDTGIAALASSKKTDAELERINTYKRTGDLTKYQTHIGSAADELSPEHKEYLMQRHGTLDLDPMPAWGDADPYNWSTWKKTINLLLVAFHACMSTFTAAAIIPAYEAIAEDFGVTIQSASYLTSLQIAVLGGAPLFWKPLSNRFGRRPIFLISLICSAAFNIGCAVSPDYKSTAACRALVAWFISPAAAIGSAVVTETFFRQERAKYMGIWTIMVTCGVPLGGFINGFVAQYLSFRWIYWLLAIINGVQFVLYVFFGPETRYLRRGVEHHGSNTKQEYFQFKRIDPTPLTFLDFIQPLKFFWYASVFIPALAYAVVFLVAGVLVTVEIPQLFGPKFHFGAQALGLQFLGLIIGSLIGEIIGGRLSDLWMTRRSKKIGGRPSPEFRLWLSYLGYILAIVGLVVFLVQINTLKSYNVTPIVGAGIAAAGNQIVTTVLITYAVDTHVEESASIGVFITFVRQILGFIGPFWFPPMFTGAGLRGSAGIVTGLIIVLSLLPTVLLQWKGQAWTRSRRDKAELA